MDIKDQKLLTVEDVAKLLGVSKRTVYRYVERGYIKEPRKYGSRCARWLHKDITRQGAR